nr:DUF3558 family protein [Labedaea rhizosphaerae]
MLTACGTTVPGTPVAVPPAAPSSSAAPAKVPRSDLDAELIELRKVDSCALLDPQAAAKVAGDSPMWLAPSDGLADCKLMLRRGRMDSWEFRTVVGAPWIHDRAAKTGIAGTTFARVQATDDSCSYTLRFRKLSAITLDVTRPYDDRRSDPCEIGRKYLEAVASTWSHLPLFSEGHTTPHLPLADVDPCDAADVDKGLGWTANPVSPSKCEIAVGADHVTVELELGYDPRKLVSPGSKTAKVVTVAGHPGCALENKYGGGYEVTVVFADAPAILLPVTLKYSEPAYQLISVVAGDQTSAETVIKEVFEAAARQPREVPASPSEVDVVPLGDLTHG